jgi:starch synthase
MEQLKIWYLATEVTPFAKTGGLGDVTGAFPKSLKLKDQEIRVIMPKYKMINERKYVLREVIRLRDIPVTLNGVTKTINVKSAFLPDSKVQIYFVEMPDYFNRPGLYTDPATGKDYDDNPERFAYFCLGALETLKILSWKPDIIHCNDWQTALAPVYLNTRYKDDEFLSGIKTVYTVHNFLYQGIFDKEVAKRIDIDDKLVAENGELEAYGKMNLMKGAIKFSDRVTTVSETYANEIITKKEFATGLEKTLEEKGKHFSGIINGVDYDVWAPETDKLIPFRYTGEDLAPKEQNKQSLMLRVNLPYKEGVPVIGMISRVIEQKGYKILIEAIDELKDVDFQLVILGVGDKELEKSLEELKKKYPGKISLNRAFDETLAHMIEAGSDFFMMPSSYEPCGMNQIYSLRYATLPIVFKTGGLADTIEEIDVEKETGNGFVFTKYSGAELTKTIKRAFALYENKDTLQQIRTRVMAQEFSWEQSTDKYLELYDQSLNE